MMKIFENNTYSEKDVRAIKIDLRMNDFMFVFNKRFTIMKRDHPERGTVSHKASRAQNFAFSVEDVEFDKRYLAYTVSEVKKWIIKRLRVTNTLEV